MTLYLTYFASAVFAAVLISVVVNVIGRTTKLFPIPGEIEIVQYGMLTAMSIGMVRTAFMDQHVRVSLFTGMMPKMPRSILLLIEGLLCALTFGMAGYQCVKLMPDAVTMNRVTNFFKIPYVLIYVILSIGLFLSAVTYIYVGISAFGPGKEKAKGQACTDEGRK